MITRDRDRIRAILNRDRAWAVYALGDLEPRQFDRCTWHVSEDDSAVVLLYAVKGAPVFLPVGEASHFPALLAEAGPPAALDLHVRGEALPAIRDRYAETRTRRLLRMHLTQAVPAEPATPLCASDLAAIHALYADGDASGESPDFFFPSMLEDRTFFGVHEGPDLVAIAGTHLVSEAESVAAIGNVYTRCDRRGRGLGASVTRAVASELQRRGIRTIALSVVATNAAAIRVYERLGFAIHCEFFDGSAAGVLS